MKIGGRKLLRSVILLSGGQFSIYALSFLRNIIFARILTKADFGIASLFALTVSLMDFNSRMGLGRQVVQAVDGDSQSFMNTAHSIQAITGILSAIFLITVSFPVAFSLKVPEKAWAFALLALVPIMRGFHNLDIARHQRKLEFKPGVYTELVPQIIITALAWPLLLLTKDFRIVIVLILLKSLMAMIMTHILSTRYYRWAWDKALSKNMWSFSWPLIINGLLMYAIQKGDRLLVGIGFSLEALALYSAAVMFVTVPFMIMAHTSSSLMLPLLSRVQNDYKLFNREYRTCLELSAVVAVIAMVPLVIGSEQILKLFFGPKYTDGGVLMAWLAAGCAFRFLRITPAIAAMARADTRNNMMANLFRITSLVIAILVIKLGGAVETVAACMMVGELIALSGSAFLLKRSLEIPYLPAIKAVVYIGACLSIPGGFIYFGSHSWSLAIVIGTSLLLMLLCIGFAWLIFPENSLRLWQQIVKLKRQSVFAR